MRVERFWTKIRHSEGHWLWTTARESEGYGVLNVDGRLTLAHRFAYELFHGPIPQGLEIDHLCMVKHCVNPDHLEPVTHRENMRRWRASRTSA